MLAHKMSLVRPAEPTPPGGERAALAAAIAARDQRRHEIDAAAKAHAAAELAVNHAHAAHQAALAGIEAARGDAARHLIATAAGTAGAAPQTIRAARDAETDAADTLAAAREAKAALAAEVLTAGSIDWPQSFVLAAAKRVVAVSGRFNALVAEVEELQVALAEKGAELCWLLRVGAVPTGEKSGPKTKEQLVAERYERPPIEWALATAAGPARWKATLDRLIVDADAEI